MNWDQVKDDWQMNKGHAREAWGELTNDDLDRVDGDRTKLVEQLQDRQG